MDGLCGCCGAGAAICGAEAFICLRIAIAPFISSWVLIFLIAMPLPSSRSNFLYWSAFFSKSPNALGSNENDGIAMAECLYWAIMAEIWMDFALAMRGHLVNNENRRSLRLVSMAN